MKLFVIVILALAAQCSAGYWDSSETNSRQSSSMEYSNQWQSSAASLPEASWFKTKVTQRIQNSSTLSGMSHLKENLFKLANEKLEKCMQPNGRELDRHCLGRATGLIMQLIASTENDNRQIVHGGYRKPANTDY